MSSLALAGIRDWHVYLCPRCNASDPPKDKYVVVVCKRKDSVWGFFINSDVPYFIRASPKLSKTQIRITPQEYDFLRHDSVIGCTDLKTFFAWELKSRIRPLNAGTIEAILAAVAATDTIDIDKQQFILASRDNR